jgi:hypothetical protein
VETPIVGALISSLAAIFCGLMVYRSSRRATDVQAQNTDATRTKQLREDLTAAESEVKKLRREVAVLTKEAEATAADLVYLRRTIWRPGMTIERLREFVGREVPPPANGREG